MLNFERHNEEWQDRKRYFRNLELTSLGIQNPDEGCGTLRRHFIHGAEPEPFDHDAD